MCVLTSHDPKQHPVSCIIVTNIPYGKWTKSKQYANICTIIYIKCIWQKKCESIA
jgi:hypothetical protein